GSLSAELWVGADSPGRFGLAGFSAVGDRVLWQRGAWGIRGGVAYDLVLVAQIGSGLQYVLHGPRLTPALTWAPFSTASSYPGFPLGQRNHFFELEVPVSGWFGAGTGAPRFVVVPGVGLNFHLVL